MFISLCITIFFTFSPDQPHQTVPSDSAIAQQFFLHGQETNLSAQPISNIIVATGKWLIGTPYEAGTLDIADTEIPVGNLHTFDCVTFIENVLALSRCIKSGRTTFGDYLNELTSIRYRGGICRGYTSRLHYFTGWIDDNIIKRTIIDVTKEAGGIPYRKKINYMTSHRERYPRMSSDSVFRVIRSTEDTLSDRQHFLLPSAAVDRRGTGIREGDCIAIATSVNGLDVSHTGIAVRASDGMLHLLHAPDTGQKVSITRETLRDFLRKRPSRTGILILRPAEP